jgi:hypothetical protein
MSATSKGSDACRTKEAGLTSWCVVRFHNLMTTPDKSTEKSGVQARPSDLTPIEPEELIQELRRLRDRIPYYGQLSVPAARSMIRVANLDADFRQEGINAVGTSTRIETHVGWTSEALQQETEAAQRWTAAESELKAMLQGVSAAILTRKYRVGTIVLQVYALLQRLVRVKGNSDLIPPFEAMKRVNRFGHKRPKAEVNTTPASENDAGER